MRRPKNAIEKPRTTIITDLLKNAKGKFVGLTVVKTNGQIRTLNGRFGVTKGLNGKGMNHDPAEKGHVIIAEVLPVHGTHGRFIANKLQYRTVNLNTLQSAVFNKKTLVAEENTIY